MITLKTYICNTSSSVEFYKRYKDLFGEVIEAEMTKDDYFILKLINKNNEELIFEYGLTSGYVGEGSNGTLDVLRLAGFEISDNVIFNNETFKLIK